MSGESNPAGRDAREGSRDSVDHTVLEPRVPGQRVGGWAMVVFAASLAAWFVLDIRARGVDPDIPEASVAFVRDHPRSWVVAGLLLWIMALSLTLAVSAVADWLGPRVASAERRSLTAVGYFSAAFLLLNGVLRVSTPGTLRYIDDLDSTWGEAAYLAVHMIGTQGLATGGLLAFSIWAVWLGLMNARIKALPRAVTLAAASPALLILMGVLGPLGVGPDLLYLVYVAAFVGLIPSSLVLGVSLMRARPAGVPA